jgi:hypothetical protein
MTNDWDDVPDEIFSVIASFLDVKPLYHFGSVCKTFSRVLDDEKYWRQIALQRGFTETFLDHFRPDHTNPYFHSIKNIVRTGTNYYTKQCSYCPKKSGYTRYKFNDKNIRSFLRISVCDRCESCFLGASSVTKDYKLTKEEKEQIHYIKEDNYRRKDKQLVDIRQVHAILKVTRGEDFLDIINQEAALRVYKMVQRRSKPKKNASDMDDDDFGVKKKSLTKKKPKLPKSAPPKKYDSSDSSDSSDEGLYKKRSKKTPVKTPKKASKYDSSDSDEEPVKKRSETSSSEDESDEPKNEKVGKKSSSDSDSDEEPVKKKKSSDSDEEVDVEMEQPSREKDSDDMESDEEIAPKKKKSESSSEEEELPKEKEKNSKTYDSDSDEDGHETRLEKIHILREKHNIEQLPPLCSGFVNEYPLKELLPMIQRERRLEKKCTKLGYNYEFLNKLLVVENYVQGSDAYTVYQLVHQLIHKLPSSGTLSNPQIERTIKAINYDRKIQVLRKICEHLKNEETDHQQVLDYVQKILDMTQGNTDTNNHFELLERVHPIHTPKYSNSFSGKVGELVQHMIDELIKYMHRTQKYTNTVTQVLLEEFIRLPKDAQRERKIVEKIESRKRKREHVPSEESAPKRHSTRKSIKKVDQDYEYNYNSQQQD